MADSLLKPSRKWETAVEELKSTWRVYVPIICEETGGYNVDGSFSYYGPSEKHAFKSLEIAIRSGLINRVNYET